MANVHHHDTMQSAIGALRLKDIVLHAARFALPMPMDGKVEMHEFVKRGIGCRRIHGVKGSSEAFEVNVNLGVRITAAQRADAPIYVEIEADYIASYDITGDVSDEALQAFATYNAVHNVWPFWRQHVFDTVNRAHLFHIDIPLFAGDPTGGVKASQGKPALPSSQTGSGSRKRGKRRVNKKRPGR